MLYFQFTIQIVLPVFQLYFYFVKALSTSSLSLPSTNEGLN